MRKLGQAMSRLVRLKKLKSNDNRPLNYYQHGLEFSARTLIGEFPMKKKRITETRIIKILKEAEDSLPLQELALSMDSAKAPTTTGKRNTAVWIAQISSA